jgi:hypothetical protein
MAGIHSIGSEPLIAEVDPRLAGRVTRLLFEGRNLLSTSESNPDNWGATYWTSPQSDWGWPPVAEVDHLPYRVLSSTPEELILRSQPARIGERLFAIEKRFALGSKAGTLDTFYTIENRGISSFRMANWEISRMPPGGLTFYPTGEAELNAIAPHSHLPIEKEEGTSFYDHAKFSGDKCLKLHADGRGGYLAHVSSGLLLLKLFADSTPDEQAPGEGECEIFANDDGKYVEIEVQGRYATIEPGAKETFSVRTVVILLPQGVTQKDRSDLRALADRAAFDFRA